MPPNENSSQGEISCSERHQPQTSLWWAGTSGSRAIGHQLDGTENENATESSNPEKSAHMGVLMTRSWRAGVVLPLALYTSSLIFTTAFWSAIGRTTTSPEDPFICLPNGSPLFPWQQRSSSTWNPALFLSITLSFGNFTSAQAKAIDISWDLLIGRAGQLILSIWVYRVMRRSLLFRMENQKIHLPLVICLTFEKATWTSLWAAIRESCLRYN